MPLVLTFVQFLAFQVLRLLQALLKPLTHTVQKPKLTLINVDDKVGCARACSEIGAQIVGVHTGLDAQAAGHTPFADLSDIASLGLPVRISVAGGIKQSTAQDVVHAGANIIVVGAAIYGAPSPAEAAREIRELVDAA